MCFICKKSGAGCVRSLLCILFIPFEKGGVWLTAYSFMSQQNCARVIFTWERLISYNRITSVWSEWAVCTVCPYKDPWLTVFCFFCLFVFSEDFCVPLHDNDTFPPPPRSTLWDRSPGNDSPRCRLRSRRSSYLSAPFPKPHLFVDFIHSASESVPAFFFFFYPGGTRLMSDGCEDAECEAWLKERKKKKKKMQWLHAGRASICMKDKLWWWFHSGEHCWTTGKQPAIKIIKRELLSISILKWLLFYQPRTSVGVGDTGSAAVLTPFILFPLEK